MEMNSAMAIVGGAGADLVLSIPLTSFGPTVTKDGQITKVHLTYNNLPCIPACELNRSGLKLLVLKTKTQDLKSTYLSPEMGQFGISAEIPMPIKRKKNMK